MKSNIINKLIICSLLLLTLMKLNAAPLSVSFDASAEGWFLTNNNTGTPIVNPMSYSGDGATSSLGCTITTTGSSNLSIAGASPTGTSYVVDADSTGGISWYRSPDLGGLDLLSTLGGTFDFSAYTYQIIAAPGDTPPGGWTASAPPSNTDAFMKVEIEGTNGTVVQAVPVLVDFTQWEQGNWIDFSFAINDSNWSGTLADLTSVLASVRNIRIRAEFIFGGDTNVCGTTEYFALDEVHLIEPLVSSLVVDKPAPTNADEDGSTTITENDTLTFTITVTNTGNTPLTNVVVTDPMITPNSNTCPTVAVGATCVLVGTYVVTAGDVATGSITNTGTGDSDETPPSDDVLIIPVVGSPALATVKAMTGNADEDGSTTITENDTLTFTITVTNSGNIPLTNVIVTDPMITPNSNTCPTVAVGATCVLVGTYVVTAGDVATGSITNTGTGDSDETPPVDDVLITPVIGSPALVIDKSLTDNTDEDASGTVTINDTLTFTIVVTNSGNIPLTNVIVTDPMITPNSNTCPTVAVGATCVLVGTYVVQQSDIGNGQIINVAEGLSDETVADPETDTETVPTERVVTAPAVISTLGQWSLLLLLLTFLVTGRTFINKLN